MAIISLVTAVKNSCLAPIQVAIDAGSGAGTIKIYSGAKPTLPSDAITSQVLLGTLTCSDPCGSTSGGILTLGTIAQDSSADATGTASWARIADSTGATVMDVDVTTTGGGGVIQMNTTNIVIGGPILISSFTFSL